MKKIILSSLFTAASLFLLTACGSNTKLDGGDLPPSQRGLSLSISCAQYGGTDGADGEAGTTSGDTMPTIAKKAICVVHTVDGNGEPVSGVTYDPSVVVNVKALSGCVGNILSTEPITFVDTNVNFTSLGVEPNDKLIIFPSCTTTDPSYLGNWKIREVSGTTLTLDNIAYNLETTEGVSYVVGDETAYGSYGSGSAHIEFPREQPIEDEAKGEFVFYVVYDPSLIGKSIYIGASTSGNRAGAAVAYVIPDDTTTEP